MPDHNDAPGPDLTHHLCQVCGLFGSFGFGSSTTEVRWWCGRHRDRGKQWWSGMRGEGGVEKAGPGAGLF